MLGNSNWNSKIIKNTVNRMEFSDYRRKDLDSIDQKTNNKEHRKLAILFAIVIIFLLLWIFF